MRGFQLAGVSNVVGGDVKGFQAAGVGNIGLNKLSGVQMAGVWNSVDTILSGVQLSGVVNVANNATQGVQFAGVMNISKDQVGSQVAGVLSMAKKVHGIQFAVVNIADSSDYPIGVFNWVKNGSRRLTLGIDESSFVSLNFKSGGRVMYSVLGLGTYLNNTNVKYGIETGLGAHLLQRERFTLSTEIVHRIQFDKNFEYHDANRSSVRIVPAINLGRHLQVYAAPSFTYAEAVEPQVGTKGVIWKFWGADPTRNTLHGGGTMGLTYIF